MALTSLGMLWAVPERPPIIQGSVNSVTIDAAGELVGMVFQIPQAGDITGVFLITRTVTTAESLNVGLYVVDTATGDPTVPLSAYKTMVAGTIAAPVANTAYEVALGTKATAAVKGDIVALVVGFTANVGNLRIGYSSNSSPPVDFPYTDAYIGVPAWAKDDGAPIVGLKYSDGSYVPIPHVFPQPSTATTLFNSGSTPDERGNKFQLPFGCRVVGWWLHLGTAIPAAGFSAVLYDSDGVTPLFTSTPDPEIEYASTGGAFSYMLATPVTLLASTDYRLTVLPGASNVQILDWTWPSAACLGMLPLGANCAECQRTDAGAWTDDTDARVLMGVIIDQIDLTPSGGTTTTGGERSFIF